MDIIAIISDIYLSIMSCVKGNMKKFTERLNLDLYILRDEEDSIM
jgi:hypothetical protein